MKNDWILISLLEALCVLLFWTRGEWHVLKKHRLLCLSYVAAYFAMEVCYFRLLLPQGLGQRGALVHFLCFLGLLSAFMHLRYGVSLFVSMIPALMIIILGNCIWPLRFLLVQELFPSPGGGVWLGSLLLCFLLEAATVDGIRRLLPSIRRMHLTVSSVLLVFLCAAPFLYYRVIRDQDFVQSSPLTQVVMSVYSLLMILSLAGNIGAAAASYEKAASEQLSYALYAQRRQVQQELSNMELVNRRYHDMKNILLLLQQEAGTPAVKERTRGLMEEIQAYERKVLTGNDAVDIVLNDKLALCEREEISFIPYINGALLSFVDALDLCILIGNAMDNAIESTRQIPSPQGRQISAKTVERGNTVLLVFRNTYGTKPVLEGGLPRTTKKDKRSHGYGMKNMQAVAEKYGGNLLCRTQGDEFVLQILLVKEHEEEP